MKMFRKLYDRGLKQAESPHAERALFWVAFAESSFFPLPSDVLLIAMVLSSRLKWFRYFWICLLGSVLGGIAGYGIAAGLWHVVQAWFFAYVFSQEVFMKVQHLYQQHDFWIVFASGVASIDLTRFIMASLFGRGGRFIIVAGMLYLFGSRIRISSRNISIWSRSSFALYGSAGLG